MEENQQQQQKGAKECERYESQKKKKKARQWGMGVHRLRWCRVFKGLKSRNARGFTRLALKKEDEG